MSFLEGKKKVTAVETIEFEYSYNELTLEFLDTSKPLDIKNISEGKKKNFSGYEVLQTNLLPPDRIEIRHKNKHYNLNKVAFANFFNKQHQDKSFYDFETNDIETHKRLICFLAFKYTDQTETNTYEIRYFKKTVKDFTTNEIEDSLFKQVTTYLNKNPLMNKEKISDKKFYLK